MKKNDVSRKGDGENSDGQRGTKAERERERESVPSHMDAMVLFLYPSL